MYSLIFFSSIFQQKFKFKMTNIKFIWCCQILHNLAQLKDIQVAKIKSLTQKTKNQATISFPEGLADTPFKCCFVTEKKFFSNGRGKYVRAQRLSSLF